MSKIKEIPENSTIEVINGEAIVPTVIVPNIIFYKPKEIYRIEDENKDFVYILILDVKDDYITALLLHCGEILSILLSDTFKRVFDKFNFINDKLIIIHKSECDNNFKNGIYETTLSNETMKNVYDKISYEYDHTNKITVSELFDYIENITDTKLSMDNLALFIENGNTENKDVTINVSDWLIDPWDSCKVEGTVEEKIDKLIVTIIPPKFV